MTLTLRPFLFFQKCLTQDKFLLICKAVKPAHLVFQTKTRLKATICVYQTTHIQLSGPAKGGQLKNPAWRQTR